MSGEKTVKNSPVIDFVRLAWDHAGGHTFSWEAFNRNVRDAVLVAVAGFPWQEGDLDRLFSFGKCRYSIRRCLDADDLERMYSTAVKAGNVSAFTEIERYLNRPPFIVDRVRIGNATRKRYRAAVGSVFLWNGEAVTVTSFGLEDVYHYVTACSYMEVDGVFGRAVKRRYRITVDDIRKERKERKTGKRGTEKKEYQQ